MSTIHTDLCVKTLNVFMGKLTIPTLDDVRSVLGGCYVGGTEMTATHEQPDVYGVTADGLSQNAEIKVSRADFLRDFKKSHRMYALKGLIAGIGNYRWYATLPDVIRPEDDLHGWGWLELIKNKLVIRRLSRHFKSDAEAEKALMVRLVRVLTTDNGKLGRKLTKTCGKSTYSIKTWPRHIDFRNYETKHNR
jgi:hypothetical protein